MEQFLDVIWQYMYTTAGSMALYVDASIAPLQNRVGPVVILILFAALTVVTTKILGKKLQTKRYLQLEKEFQHWLTVRQEATACSDREKGARMARNIDQAKLNRCYYDYFLEGFLLGLATMYIPIFIVISYINSFYRPERLMELTGKGYIFQFDLFVQEPVLIGSVFFYFAVLLLFYAAFAFLVKGLARHRQQKKTKINSQQSVITG